MASVLCPFPCQRVSMRAEDFDRITRAGAVVTDASAAKAEVILLSRALYRSRVLNLRGVRASERREAIQLQLAAWEPFDSSSYKVGLRSDYALAFAWDAVLLDQVLSKSGLNPARAVEPECLYQEPLAAGARLSRCLDGYEAQVWDGGLLIDGRWWANLPPEAEWRAFVDSHALEAALVDGSPSAGSPNWRKRPWLRVVSPEEVGNAPLGGLRRVSLGAACLLALWAGLEARGWMEASDRLSALKAEESELQERLRPLLADRAEAEATSAKANRLSSALSGHPPLEVLEQLVVGLPAQGVQLQELALEGRRLRVVLNLSTDVPRAAIVRQLQASGFFTGVTEARGAAPTSVVFEMSLPSPIGTPERPASGTASQSASPGRSAP